MVLKSLPVSFLVHKHQSEVLLVYLRFYENLRQHIIMVCYTWSDFHRFHQVGLYIKNKSGMFSSLVGRVTNCVRLNSFNRSMNSSYWRGCLQSGEMVGIFFVQENLE